MFTTKLFFRVPTGLEFREKVWILFWVFQDWKSLGICQDGCELCLEVFQKYIKILRIDRFDQNLNVTQVVEITKIWVKLVGKIVIENCNFGLEGERKMVNELYYNWIVSGTLFLETLISNHINRILTSYRQ